MFSKLLIANRGEIAVRIIRTCREMGIATVAVYSTADENALHVQMADEAVCIGGARVAESYLNAQNILSAALGTGATAIHPGFGFLSENSDFARLCEKSGIIFIGPKGDVIDKMGNKSAARALMMACDVPVVPGSDGSVFNANEALELAKKIGYPILIKASAGGGGRGMRRAYSEDEFVAQFNAAQMEAKSAFGDDEMYLEKLVINPKHVEIQILADEKGNVVYLGERDCSVQRRNQKLVEESPCKILSEEQRKAMGDAAVRAAKAADYTNAGTVEFVLDDEGNFYFIEMNTRIQVEHPVTEMRCGLDLIRWQICISAGLPLAFSQEEIVMSGHAIECRINGENLAKNFMPSVGKVEFLHLPAGVGVRTDTHLYTGYEMPPYYDSMLCKVIVHAPTRLEAIRKMRRALSELIIDGMQTTARLQDFILHHPDFVKGQFNTGFIEKHWQEFIEVCPQED